MDYEKIASRVAVEPEDSDLGVQVDFSLHGMVSVNVRVDPSWLDEDGDVLPQYKDQVRATAKQKAAQLLQNVPDQVQWQLEEM